MIVHKRQLETLTVGNGRNQRIWDAKSRENDGSSVQFPETKEGFRNLDKQKKKKKNNEIENMAD